MEKTMENHPVDPLRKDASSKRGPGEKHRAGKQTSASTTTNGGGSVEG